ALLLLQAWSELTCVAAEALNFVPACFRNSVDPAFELARDAIQRQPASTTQLVLMGQHAQCDAPATGCNRSAKIVEVSSTSVLDRYDRSGHAISERGLRLIVGQFA